MPKLSVEVRPGDAEVNQHDLLALWRMSEVRAKQNVVRFEVIVDVAALMEPLEAVDQLNADLHRRFNREPLVLRVPQHVFQARAVLANHYVVVVSAANTIGDQLSDQLDIVPLQCEQHLDLPIVLSYFNLGNLCTG